MNKRTTTIFWIVAGIIVILAAVFAYLYSYTDIFKKSASTNVQWELFTTDNANTTDQNYVCRFDAALTTKDCTFPTGMTTGGNSIAAIGNDLYISSNKNNGTIWQVDIAQWKLLKSVTGTRSAKIPGDRIVANKDGVYVLGNDHIYSWTRDLATQTHNTDPTGEKLAKEIGGRSTINGGKSITVDDKYIYAAYPRTNVGLFNNIDHAFWIKKIDIENWKVDKAAFLYLGELFDITGTKITGITLPKTLPWGDATDMFPEGDNLQLLNVENVGSNSRICQWSKDLIPTSCKNVTPISTPAFGGNLDDRFTSDGNGNFYSTASGNGTSTSRIRAVALSTMTVSKELKQATGTGVKGNSPAGMSFLIPSAVVECTGVTVFSDKNYLGTSACLTGATYNSAALVAEGIVDNTISSLKLSTGYSVTLYDLDAAGQPSIALTSDTSDLSLVTGTLTTGLNWDDRTSSINITAPSSADLTVTPSSITAGESATLSWTGADSSCAATPAGWFDSSLASGSAAITPTASQTYVLTCGSLVKTVSLTVTPAALNNTVTPTVDLKGNTKDGPFSITSGGFVRLTWSTTGLSYASSCTASGSPSWTGVKANSDSTGVLISGITSATTFTLSCSEGSQVATDSVVVTIAGTTSTGTTTGTSTTGTTAGTTTTTGTADTGPDLPIIAVLAVAGSAILVFMINRAIKLIRN